MRQSQFLPEVESLILSTRRLAERLGNNFISVNHFLLCADKFNRESKMDLSLRYSEAKVLIEEIKGKWIEEIKGEDFPLTKQLEYGLRASIFHKMILGDDFIKTEHVYLAIVSYETENKSAYLELLKQNQIILNTLKKKLIQIYFSHAARKSGLVRLLYFFS